MFKSWNEVIFDSNLFMFLEEDAFMGITEPNSGKLFDYKKVFNDSAEKYFFHYLGPRYIKSDEK